MNEETAIVKTLECLAYNIDQAKVAYAWASTALRCEGEISPHWFFDRMQKYRNAEYALMNGDRKPAIALIDSLIKSAKSMGCSDRALRQGLYPLIPLRDGLLGIDTPIEP